VFANNQVSRSKRHCCLLLSVNVCYFHCFRDQNEVDVRAVYHQLMDTYGTTDSDGDGEAGPSTSNASGARR